MSRTSRRKPSPEGSTRAKGDILEEIVARMHEVQGVLVERNVRLPIYHGVKRTREIDVLITSQTAGIPIRIAIECKNENEKTGIEKIDAFIGKLKDINIPSQLGIFVSKRGYTTGAVDRAREVGIKTLILEDLSSVENNIFHAFQSIVYLLPTITNIRVTNNIGGAAPVSEFLFFRDKKERVCGSIPDLVWKDWIFEKIPARIGSTELLIKKPSGWRQIIQGQEAEVKKISVTIKIIGHAITFGGSVNQYNLVNAADKSIDKSQLTAKFEPPVGKFHVTHFNSEDDLKNYQKTNGQIHILNRIRTPRVVFNAMYWPPSKSTLQKLNQLAITAMATKREFNLSSLSLSEIEGDDLSKLWDPIIEDHPMLKEISNAFLRRRK